MELVEKINIKGISGSTLKLIAIITMLIDHIGATIVYRMLLLRAQSNLNVAGWPPFLITFVNSENLQTIYTCLRYIGRIAFPIFCFLLVEGFKYTRDKKQYGIRLFIFAFISEIPFDLSLASGISWKRQNVFFTLFLGYLTIVGIHFIGKKLAAKNWQRVIGTIAVVYVGMKIADFLRTDYASTGVFAIAILYLLRNIKLAQLGAGALIFLYERTAPLAFIPIALYNGKRGWKLKYVFYLFYPVHLMMLYWLCCLLRITSVSVI